MLVGKTKNEINKLWDTFHSGGMTDPLSTIKQLTYLLFIRRLDDMETLNERREKRIGKKTSKKIFPENKQHLRWNNFKHKESGEMLKILRDEVFPFIKELGKERLEEAVVTTFATTMKDAIFEIQKASVLQTAVDIISNLDLDNADTAGDLYEYLLSSLQLSGRNGQFRTPRHIIKMMVEIVDPNIDDVVCDPACGTAGFLFASINYILEKNTSKNLIQKDSEGNKYGFIGDKLTEGQKRKFQTTTFFGYDFDTTMLQISSMNLWLHGIQEPHIKYSDTLSRNFTEENKYSLILANPPFKGSLDYDDVHPNLISEMKTKKTELLFLELTLRLLDIGGRCAIIVPDGVLFGSSNAHVGIRKKLVENHQLEGIIGMPGGVFKPYAGVSTAILIFTKGGKTDKVWFYDMEHDGYSLDDKRDPVKENDIPDIIDCWKNRNDKSFQIKAEKRMKELRGKMAPLKKERLKHHEEINKLQFESVLDEENTKLQSKLEENKKDLKELDDKIHVLQSEFNQLSRQFWVEKKDIADNYDLSTSSYRDIEQDEIYLPPAEITLNRILELEELIKSESKNLMGLLK